MKVTQVTLALFILGMMVGCHSNPQEKHSTDPESYPDLKVVGAMKNVMWKGELGSVIELDTISDKKGLYGIGPVSYLRGELLINDGISYVSKVTSDSTMHVEKTFLTSAPFFVYSHVSDWIEMDLPSSIKSIKDLEEFINNETLENKRPFTFKLMGTVREAEIHVQNLPEGNKVSSPAEAHQGQINFIIQNEEVEIIGFFSRIHQGVFTHHDTFFHMHLITRDEKKMGHLDRIEFNEMRLFVPKK